MEFRVFNDFKRRLLAGDVEEKFDCTAYLLNSAYEAIMENNLYARTVNDFTKANSTALYLDTNNKLAGKAIENCTAYQNTYYRIPEISEDDEDTGMYTIVNSANVSAFSALLGINGDFSASRFSDYLKKYSYFYMVSRADEFARLVKDCKENEYETFAVVLADDIEHVVVDSTCFGSTRAKPFRGVFDGNGYALHVAGINAKKRSNGIFGYIAEEGVVRNLIIKADELSNYTNNAITIQNAATISLDTIKAGEGDVKIGVLAGVNNGTVENILLSADIIYDGNLTPEVYFVQNKCNSTSVVSNAWMQLPANLRSSLTNSVSLSSFDNFFYPTQLCINSYANIIPYVGYFNEGCINQSATNTYKLDDPMYTLSAEKYTYPNDDDGPNTLFMPDIATFNCAKVGQKIDDLGRTNSKYNEWYLGHKGYDTDYALTTATTFRMGPNNKEAFLLGALFGLNNGDLNNVAVKNLTTFDTNTVALVGGIAGRGARGKLNNVYVQAYFSATSSMYEHYISTQSEQVTTAGKQDFYLPKRGTNLYDGAHPGDHELNLMYSYVNTDESDAFSGAKNVSALYVADAVDSDDILATISANAEYEGKVTQNKNTIYALARATTPVTSIFEDETRSTGNVKNLFSLDFTSANITTPNKIQLSAVFFDEDLNLTQSAACKIYDVIVNDYYALGTNQPSTSYLTAVGSDAVYNYADNRTLTIKPTVTLLFSGEYCLTLRTVKGYVKMPLEDLMLKDVSAVSDAFTTSAYNTDFKIHLNPLVNIGGMFGEYVYSDAQSVDNAAVHISAINFSGASGYKQANVLSYFTPNLTFDSSNKSNADTYSATQFYSAHANVKNKLYCSACAHDNVTLYNPISNCADLYPAAWFMHFMNVYNQIAPAIVSTQYTFTEHAKRKTKPPALGSMYTDYNFYQYGLNMGSKSDGYDDPDDYGNYLLTTANSGIYFNFPGQISYYNTNESYAGNKNLWNYNTLIDAAYDFKNIPGITTTFRTFVTKQLATAPQHLPMYRGRASIRDNGTKVTFEAEHYNQVSVSTTTGTVAGLNACINSVLTNINSSRTETNDPIYIYSHSARAVNTKLCKVPLTMYYTDYAVFGHYDYEHTYESTAVNAWLANSNSARCYALSSDSYKYVAVEPKYEGTREYNDDTGVPISANSLVYGFIPTSADIVRALNVAEDATLECSGIKSNNLNYLLVIDKENRPIFDMKLDVTAVDNDGYYLKFPQIYVDRYTAYDDSQSMGYHTTALAARPKLGGIAINIENGNN